MHRSRSTRITLALAAIALVGATSACSGGDDDDAGASGDDGASVADAGAEDGRIKLPGNVEVGQTSSSTATVAIEIGISGLGSDEAVPATIAMGIDSEVVEVDTESGGYTVESVFVSADVVDAPASADLGVLSDLIGIRIRQDVSADGEGGDVELVDEDQLSASQREAFEQFGTQVGATALDYPDEPVGEGATWTAVTSTAGSGFEVEIEYHYTLTSVDGDAYTIAVDYDEDIDTDVEADGEKAHVTGTITGSGTASGSINSPLQVATSVSQDADLSFEFDGQSMSMTMDVDVTVEPTGG